MYSTTLLSAAILASQINALTLQAEVTIDAPNNDYPIEDILFSRNRCGNWFLTRDNGTRNFCDECNSSTTNGTCAWSWPKSDTRKWRSENAACRCNPHETFIKLNQEIDMYENCITLGRSGCHRDGAQATGEAEGTCHWSYPWFNRSNVTK